MLACLLSHSHTPTDSHGPVEYFLASDPSAVIEYTNRVLFLEDDDVAAIQVKRKEGRKEGR